MTSLASIADRYDTPPHDEPEVRNVVHSYPLTSTRLGALERMAREGGHGLGANSSLIQEIARRKKYDEQRKPCFDARLKELACTSRLLIIDLECTCEPDPQYKGDVIEIGAVLIDVPRFELLHELQYYTRPTLTEVTGFCTELTGITADTVSGAPSFSARMRELADFIAEHSVESWASYGKFDKNQVARQCERESVANPLEALTHMNIKWIAGAHHGFGKVSPGLGAVLSLMQIDRHGRAHCGLDDSMSVAAVLGQILHAHDLIECSGLRKPTFSGGKAHHR